MNYYYDVLVYRLKISERKQNPILLELYWRLVSLFCSLVALAVSFTVIFVSLCFFDDSVAFRESIIIACIFSLGLIAFISIGVLSSIPRDAYGFLLDILTKKKFCKQTVSIETIYGQCRYGNWDVRPLDILFPKEYEAIPVTVYCRNLNSEQRDPMICKKNKICFYKNDSKKYPLSYPKNTTKYYTVMTRQKSDLIDQLYELEPTAAFEITYLKYSRQLQKIAPIPGWEYADGVAELCDEISNMYP